MNLPKMFRRFHTATVTRLSTTGGGANKASPSKPPLAPNDSSQSPSSDLFKVAQGLLAVAQNASTTTTKTNGLQERYVPVSAASRFVGFGGLAVGLAMGTAKNILKQAINSSPNNANTQDPLHAYSALLSEENAVRLADTLTRMRGAALKIGQLLSMQDDAIIPPHFQKILERARQHANIMPKSQLDQAMSSQLGANWRELFLEFHDHPVAAASIGQVHRAVLKDGTNVAVKIQYPGVADSVDSDLANLRRVLRVLNLPRGLFMDQIIDVARVELAAECDYQQELANQTKYAELLKGNSVVNVPRAFPDLSSQRVLTTEWMEGVTIDLVAQSSDASLRDRIGTELMRLTLHELFELRFMQTDPNPANFLFDQSTGRINLIDFGACRSFDTRFSTAYLLAAQASTERDREKLLAVAKGLGLLTGEETLAHMNAFVAASFAVGEVFAEPSPDATSRLYDFGKQTVISNLIPLSKPLIEDRLRAPDEQAIYALHRKLAGIFMLCAKLKAKVPTRDLFLEIWQRNHSKL